MRIAAINMLTVGSTGRIMLQLAQSARERGHEVYTYSPHDYSPHYIKMPEPPEGHKYYGTYRERWLHNFVGRVIGCNGLLSHRGTRRLIKELKKNNIEILHLNNLHSYCINLPMLFRFIKKHSIRVIWTLHDCWSFTGHCPHFDMIGCDKWKTGCHRCPQYREYPQCRIDNSKYMYAMKKKWFTGVKDMTLVAPSHWIAHMARQSFLKDYPVEVINNGIDLSIFKPCHGSFRKQYNCEDKYIILGVAFGWDKKKGLDVFIELSERLSDRYKIVLVGTDDNVDRYLPDSIISIHQTLDQQELAQIYTAADLFVNPTREESFPTVNIEALACSTPVLTFKTGGSPEIIDETCGAVVDKDDIDALEREIYRIARYAPYSADSCTSRASVFSNEHKLKEYIELYERTSG